jgi:hypothetical protein
MANPKAIEIPNKPMPEGPVVLVEAITADPQPKSTRLNVPINSAISFFVSSFVYDFGL